MSVHKLNRREFIKASTVGVIGAAMAAAGASTYSASSKAEKRKDFIDQAAQLVDEESYSLYHEAPELKERVALDSLPPVDQRLPENPRVVSGAKEIGTYGGVIRMIHKGTTEFVSNYAPGISYPTHRRECIFGNATPIIGRLTWPATSYLILADYGTIWSAMIQRSRANLVRGRLTC